VKAIVGLGIGMFFLLASGCMVWIGPASERRPEWLGETLFAGVILSPLFMTWGAIHVAWFRGASPHGPLLVSIAGFVFSLFLPAVVAIPLMIVGPLILALCLPSRRSNLVGRWRRGRRR